MDTNQLGRSLPKNNGKFYSDKHFLTLTRHLGSDIGLGPVTQYYKGLSLWYLGFSIMHGSQDGCSGFRHHNCAYGKNKEKAVRSPLVFPFYWESKAFLGTFLVDFLLCLVARTVGAFKPYQQERWGKGVFSFPDSTEKTGKRDGRGKVPLCDPVTVYAWITTREGF